MIHPIQARSGSYIDFENLAEFTFEAPFIPPPSTSLTAEAEFLLAYNFGQIKSIPDLAAVLRKHVAIMDEFDLMRRSRPMVETCPSCCSVYDGRLHQYVCPACGYDHYEVPF